MAQPMATQADAQRIVHTALLPQWNLELQSRQAYLAANAWWLWIFPAFKGELVRQLEALVKKIDSV